MIRTSHFGLAAALLAAAPLAAQTQKVTPPKTVYWMSAATQSGFGMTGAAPSAADMMRMATGGGASSPIKSLDLDLGSSLPPSGPPAAAHAIPPGMAMGASLPLTTPPKPSGRAERPERIEDDFERPKGKLLVFWGCSETARPGQPIIFDFAKMAAGEIPPDLFGGEQPRTARGPSANSWPTYGHWPNTDKRSPQTVPGNASMLGAHKISGNYPPTMDFNLQQDWMAGLDLRQTKLPSGGLSLQWNAAPGATAHFAQMMGGAEGADKNPTIVFWSSSDTQSFVSALSDYVSPSEAARFVGKKKLMPASQTSCSIPKEAIAAAQGGMLTLVAHGPEVNIIHPPRPTDPKIPWVQEWAVKARYVSRTGALAGMDMAEATGSSQSASKSKPKCTPATKTNAANEVAGAVAGVLSGGMFGRKKPKDCED